MAWTKAKTAIIGAVVIGCIATTTLVIHHPRDPQNQTWTRDRLANSGYATPQAALKTLLWSIDQGDAETVLASFTPTGKNNIQAAFQGRLDAKLEQFKQRMAGVVHFQISVESGSADNVTVDLVSTDDHGQTHERKYWFKKIGNEWKCDQIHPSFDLTD